MLHRMKAAIGTLNTRMKHRRDYDRLMNLDDHLLRDIGVRRGDVIRARQSGHLD